MSKDEKLGTCENFHGTINQRPGTIPHVKSPRCVNWREQPAPGEPSLPQTSPFREVAEATAWKPEGGEKPSVTHDGVHYVSSDGGVNYTPSSPPAPEPRHDPNDATYDFFAQPPAPAGGAREWLDANKAKHIGSDGMINLPRLLTAYADSEREARERAERLLQNLLAVIHRDGGHYTAEHGLEKSCADAEKLIPAERVRAEGALREIEERTRPDGDMADRAVNERALAALKSSQEEGKL